MRDGPSTIEVARRKNTRTQKHADGLALVFAVVNLKVEVDTLAIIAAVPVMVDMRAEREVFAIWNTTRITPGR